MATLYSDIYDVFLGKITDYDLPFFSEEDRESILYGFMVSSCSKFKRVCKKVSGVDLSDRDDSKKQFNLDLSDEQKNIIATGMIVEWVSPKYFNDENMRNMLNAKDYKMAASPVNVLGGVRNTYLQIKKEFKSAINEYSFMNGDTD